MHCRHAGVEVCGAWDLLHDAVALSALSEELDEGVPKPEADVWRRLRALRQLSVAEVQALEFDHEQPAVLLSQGKTVEAVEHVFFYASGMLEGETAARA